MKIAAVIVLLILAAVAEELSEIPTIAFLIGAVIIWLIFRKALRSTNTRSDVLLPAITENPDNFAANTESVRQQTFKLIEELIADRGFSAQVLSTPAHDPDPVIRIEVNLRDRKGSQVIHVTSATIAISSHPFHRFEQLFDLNIDTGLRKRHWRNITLMTRAEVAAIIDILTLKTNIKKFKPLRARSYPWQFLRVKNQITAVKTQHPQAILLAIFPIAAIFLPRHATHRLSTGQPPQAPRRLVRLDSWQTRIEQIGSSSEPLRQQVQDRLRDHLPEEAQLDIETLTYWGATGKVERDQIVVSLRRSIAFVHLYSYGEDLYIGWDAHVNSASWQEQLVGSGFRNSIPVDLYAVRPVYHSPNEYDLFDANFISESIHATLTKTVKKIVREHNIDQEIDYSIVRESRRDVVTPDAKPKKRFSRAS